MPDKLHGAYEGITQCMDCNTIKDYHGETYSGPQPDRMVYHMSGPADAPFFTDEVTEEHYPNISHGLCDSCFETRMAPIRAKRAAMERPAPEPEPEPVEPEPEPAPETPRPRRFRRGRRRKEGD